MADNAADQSVDWAMTQAINLSRVEAGSKAQVLAVLQDLEGEIVGILDKNKASIGKQKKLEEIQTAVNQVTAVHYAKVAAGHQDTLTGVAKSQGKGQTAAMNATIGASVLDPVLSDKQWEALASKTLVFGASSGEWWSGQSASLQDKFSKQMRMGYGLGESVEELTRRVRGTKANGFNDGIMSTSRREAEALVRSSIQTISNTAKIESIKGMQPIAKGIQWLSTLDSRTTHICMALNGAQWRFPDMEPVGHGKAFPGPTAHWNCRSTQTAVTASWAELAGKKIPALDGKSLQAAVEAKLAAQGMDPLKIAQVKVRAQASMDGQVAAQLDWESWLKTKPQQFIHDVLGPGRAKLWQDGKLKLNDLTDQDNRPLTIKALEAAIEAGTIPDETEGQPFVPLPAIPKFKTPNQAVEHKADNGGVVPSAQTQAQWEAGLTAEQKAAIQYWSTDMYAVGDIRNAAAGQTPQNPLAHVFLKTIDEAPSYKGKVYRGDTTGEDPLIKFQIGDEIEFKRPASSSKSLAVAEEFAGYGMDDNRIVYEIETDDGVDISKHVLAEYEDQEEIILRGKRKYAIGSVELISHPDGDYWLVKVKAVNAEESLGTVIPPETYDVELSKPWSDDWKKTLKEFAKQQDIDIPKNTKWIDATDIDFGDDARNLIRDAIMQANGGNLAILRDKTGKIVAAAHWTEPYQGEISLESLGSIAPRGGVQALRICLQDAQNQNAGFTLMSLDENSTKFYEKFGIMGEGEGPNQWHTLAADEVGPTIARIDAYLAPQASSGASDSGTPNQAFDPASPSQWPETNPDEFQLYAIKHYSGASYEINIGLRQGEDWENWEFNAPMGEIDGATLVQNLDSYLAAAPQTNDDLLVHRGVAFSEAEFKKIFKPGELFTDAGFMSTTHDASTLKGGSESWSLEIQIPKGSKHVARIDMFAQAKAEKEVLIGRDGTFEVVSVDLKTKKAILRYLGKAGHLQVSEPAAPPNTSTKKPVSAAAAGPDQSAAAATIADILANPKGQTLKVAALKSLQAKEPDLPPVQMLAKAEGIASEKQAAASKASILSQAKKKLVAGETPTPGQYKLLNSLPVEEQNAFLASVEEGKQASAGMIYPEIEKAIAEQGGKLTPEQTAKMNLLPADELKYLTGKIVAIEQDATVAKLKAFNGVEEIYADPDLAKEFSALPPVYKVEIADHFFVKNQNAEATKTIDEWTAAGGDKAKAISEAKQMGAGLNVSPATIVDQAEVLYQDKLAKKAYTELQAIQIGQAEKQATLKQKALSKVLADLGSDLESLSPTDYQDILDTVVEEAATKQAAASKASKLATAKKKLVAGKYPSLAEQAVMDSLTDEESYNFAQAVAEAQALKAAPVAGLKVEIEDGTLDKKKGLKSLKKLQPIKGSDYEDFLDYLEDDELVDYKVNALPIVPPTPEWEAGEVAGLLTDTDKAKLPNQLTKIPLAKAITNQVYIRASDVEHYLQTGKTDSDNPAHLGKPPLVIKLGGQYQIHDGNHRANAYWLAGEIEMPALVYDLDAAIATDPKNETVQKIFSGDPPASIVAAAKASYAESNPVIKTEIAAAAKKATKLISEEEATSELAGIMASGDEELIDLIADQTGVEIDADEGIMFGEAKATFKAYFDQLIDDDPSGNAEAEFLTTAKKIIDAAAKKAKADLKKAKAQLKAATAQDTSETGPEAKKLVVPDLGQLKKIKDLPGSTQPYLAEDPATGNRYVVKSTTTGLDQAHLKSEATADAIYRAAGLNVPASTMADANTKIAEFLEGQTLDQWQSGKSQDEKNAMYREIRKGFVADALLANHDVAGASFDNIFITTEGIPVRIDNGGAMSFRANGSPKGGWDDPTGAIAELESMRDPGIAPIVSKITKGITQAEIEEQVTSLLSRRKAIEKAAKPLPKKDRDALARRFDWLEQEFTHLKPNASTAETAKLLQELNLPPDIPKRVKTARLNGIAVRLGTRHIEDTQALAWTETDLVGKQVTVVQLKVTDEGAKAIQEKMAQDFSGAVTESPDNIQAGQHPEDHFSEPFIAAAKTLVVHAEDGGFNQATLQNLADQGAILAQMTASDEPAKKALAAHYQPLWDQLMDAAHESTIGPIQKADVPFITPWHYDPTKYATKKKAPKPPTGKLIERINQFRGRQNTFKDGEGTNTIGQAMSFPLANGGHRIKTTDGVVVEYAIRKGTVDQRSGLALEGRVVVRVPGDISPAKLERAMQELADLGIDIAPPSDDYKEYLLIRKTAALTKATRTLNWKQIDDIPDDAARAEAARRFAKDTWGATLPKRGTVGWQKLVDGEANHDGTGWKTWERIDLGKTPGQNFNQYHLQHSTGTDIVNTVKDMLESGGEATSTMGRLQKGVPVKNGASPGLDVTSGGASYFFTRIRNKSDVEPGSKLYFKGELLKRADAITYTSDVYGAIEETHTRKFDPAEYQKIASRKSSDETLFKNAIDLARDIDTIQTVMPEQRAEVIALFKQHGYAKLPDGRKIEDVVK